MAEQGFSCIKYSFLLESTFLINSGGVEIPLLAFLRPALSGLIYGVEMCIGKVTSLSLCIFLWLP